MTTLDANRRGESGSVSLLIIGLMAVALMLVAVVVNASAAYLQRQSLLALADGAALAGADALATHGFYVSAEDRSADDSVDLLLDPDQTAAQVADYLRTTQAAAHFPGLTWQVTTSEAAVTVEMSAPINLPLVPPGWVGSAQVNAASSAVADQR